MDVKNPVLLKGQTLEAAAVLRPYGLKLTIVGNGISNGSMILGPSEPAITVGAWLRVWTCQGDMGVFRVTSINQDVTGKKRTVSFEHLISALGDSIIFDEVKATDIDPKAEDFGGATIAQSIKKVLSYQKTVLWEFRHSDFSDRQMFSFLQQPVWDALQSILNTLDGHELNFDMSALPFKLSVKAAATDPVCEMRMNRNITTMQKSINRNDMFTRLYPVGDKDLHIDNVNGGRPYITQNTGTYGVVEATRQEPSITDEKELLAWGKAQLKKFSKPSVTITISGLELSGSTGLAIDKLVVGTVCNVPLPELGSVETERITQLSWADAIGKPEAVTVTLANNRKTVQGVVEQLQSQQSKSSRRGGKNSKDSDDVYHTWYERTEKEISEGAARVDKAEAAILDIHKTADEFRQEMTKLDRRTGDLEQSVVIQKADGIWDIVGEFSFDKSGNLVISNCGGLIIKKDKTEMGLFKDGKLDAGMIVSALNDGKTTVKIKGDLIDLDGTTIADLLVGKAVSAKTLTASGGVFSNLVSTNELRIGGTTTVIDSERNVTGAKILGTDVQVFAGVPIAPVSVKNAIRDVAIDEEATSGDSVTLNFTKINGDVIPITFNRAPTVSLSQVWQTGESAGHALITAYKSGSVSEVYATLDTVIRQKPGSAEDDASWTYEPLISKKWHGYIPVQSNFNGSATAYIDTGVKAHIVGDVPFNDGYAKGKASVTGEAPRSWIKSYFDPGLVANSSCSLSNGGFITLSARFVTDPVGADNIRKTHFFVNDIDTTVVDELDLGETYNQGVEAGKKAVTLKQEWTDDQDKPTYTVKTVGRTDTLSYAVTLEPYIPASWIGHKKFVEVRTGNTARMTIQIDAKDEYTKGVAAGKESINPSGYFWDGDPTAPEIFISTKMPGRDTTYNRMSLSLLSGNFDDEHKAKVVLKYKSPSATTSGSTKATLQIDATSVYEKGVEDGLGDATLTNFEWDSADLSVRDKKVSIGISGTSKKKSLRLSLSAAGWSSGVNNVFLKYGSTLNTNIMRLKVELPELTHTVTSPTGTLANTSFSIRAGCGGKTHTFNAKLTYNPSTHRVQLTNESGSTVYAQIVAL